jgi:hypothetical protein
MKILNDQKTFSYPYKVWHQKIQDEYIDLSYRITYPKYPIWKNPFEQKMLLSDN